MVLDVEGEEVREALEEQGACACCAVALQRRLPWKTGKTRMRTGIDMRDKL